VNEPKPSQNVRPAPTRLDRAVMSMAGLLGTRSRPVLTIYRLTPPGFAALRRPIRIAALADIHACEPWMTVERIAEIVAETNRLAPDLVVLLGDYVCAIRGWQRGIIPMRDWAAALSGLRAPLGVYAVLGNHDWRLGGEEARAALEASGVTVLENDARLLHPDGVEPFWLAGLGDQRAEALGGGRYRGRDDLPATLAGIDDGSPVILLAHEPDIFPAVPPRVVLTLSGHTHGGQCRLPLVGPLVVPSRYWRRYAYGHIVESGRHLIVSGGLGYSGLPIRIGMPPEIVLVELGGGNGLPASAR
jgi:predicted MPP superfamily phosphohydrolase